MPELVIRELPLPKKLSIMFYELPQLNWRAHCWSDGDGTFFLALGDDWAVPGPYGGQNVYYDYVKDALDAYATVLRLATEAMEVNK